MIFRAADAATLRLSDPGFPACLGEIPDPPESLRVAGRLRAGAAAVALVGTRRPTSYGIRMARKFAEGLCRAGVILVSGLARGVDTIAHRTAVELGAETWAVLGTGLSRVYPEENAALASEIVKNGGAVLSEFEDGEGPQRRNFPRRNRIISGLALGTLVIEGDERSGALITARTAAEQGREVFAVPGPADSRMSRAPHRLLKNGACLVLEPEDVLEELRELRRARPTEPLGEEAPPPGASGETDPENAEILDLLSAEAMGVEQLAERTGWELPRLLRVLTWMETEGIICAQPGQQYGRL